MSFVIFILDYVATRVVEMLTGGTINYMKETAYDELTIEKKLKAHFGIPVNIRQVIVFQAPVSHVAQATLFLSDKKQLYLYIEAESRLVLGDVQKIITRMGLKAELCIPPKGHTDYFREVGISKFNEVFPGRKNVNDRDIAFYKTLAPYNPALVLIKEVRDGRVYQYDTDATTGWRVATKFTYRRIKTS